MTEQEKIGSTSEQESEFLVRNRIRMGQLGIGSKTVTPSLSSIRANPIAMASTRLVSFQQPNDGYTLLRMSHPHIIAELEQYTLSWTLAGKYILINKSVLAAYIANTRELLMFDIVKQAPIYIPPTMTVNDYIQHMKQFVEFLESTVFPLVPDVAQPDQVQTAAQDSVVTVTSEDMADLAAADSGE